jgi:hypothetical protein
MKRITHSGGALAVVLAAATLCSFTPGLSAQSQDSPPPSQGQQQDQQKSKTFAGKIQKLGNGQLALVTGQTPDGKLAGHLLDDQDGAKKYEGKQVTVTGTFDTATNTIHVTNIQAA